MLFRSFAVLSAVLSSGVASILRCATPSPPPELLQISHEFATSEAAEANLKSRDCSARISVDVYFHTVASTQEKLLSDSVISEQFDVLATAFRSHGIRMNLANVTKSVNVDWSFGRRDMEMKRILRGGDYSAMNIYFHEDLQTLLGLCYYPTEAPIGSDAFFRDGCHVHAASVPGGTFPGADLGMTAVHEAGHWFGLLHTFEGGCSEPGDEVADTPAHSGETRGCPVGQDSCPNMPGLDPIHNYMDYSDDSCKEEFTPGQMRRALSFWHRYRSTSAP